GEGPTEYPANDVRLWRLLEALRCDAADGVIEALHAETGIDRWFLAKLRNIVRMEQRLAARPLTPTLLRTAKRMGFSDKQVADLTPEGEREILKQRTQSFAESGDKAILNASVPPPSTDLSTSDSASSVSS